MTAFVQGVQQLGWAESRNIRFNEVTNVGSDRSQLSPMAKAAKATLAVEKLDAIADRGYFNGEELLACDKASRLRCPSR